MSRCFLFKKVGTTIFNYKINAQSLNRSYEIKDLGILFDSKLSFASHIDFIVSKSFAMIGFIRRNSGDFKDPMTLRSLYISLVRSRLEYCSFIWNPFYEVHSCKIERVQKIFTKIALRMLRWPDGLPSYTSRRKLLGLQALYERRTCSSLLFAYNIINSNIKCSDLSNLFIPYIPPRNLRHTRLFIEVTHKTNYAMNEPIVKTIHLANRYSSVLNFNSSLYKFKLELFSIFN